jgi:hypothetical protein
MVLSRGLRNNVATEVVAHPAGNKRATDAVFVNERSWASHEPVPKLRRSPYLKRSFPPMRATLIAVVMSFLAFGATAMAEPSAYQQPGVFPRDEASLRDLDNQQLRIVRRAGAMCFHSGEGGFLANTSVRGRACIMSLADHAVADSQNPALQAYHQALPLQARYDENRPGYYWQRLIASRD